jgi:hypothetical protein
MNNAFTIGLWIEQYLQTTTEWSRFLVGGTAFTMLEWPDILASRYPENLLHYYTKIRPANLLELCSESKIHRLPAIDNMLS